MTDNVYDMASRTIASLQEEVRDWRIRAEDAEKDLEETRVQLKHYRRMAEIHDQIIQHKDGAVLAYKEMVGYLEGTGMIKQQSEEILRLQRALKFALAHVDRGDNPMFTFENGDEAEYGPQLLDTLEMHDGNES